MIIGIILLLGAGVFFFVMSSSPEGENEVVENVEQVPIEVRPVVAFVQQCLKTTAEKAITDIGKHGGYMYSGQFASNINEWTPTESDGLRIFPGDVNTDIPYWSYFKSSNTCVRNCRCDSKEPELYERPGAISIEKQIEDYVESNINVCLGSFSAFEMTGLEVEAGDPEVNLEIRRDDLGLTMKYPITIKREDFKTSYDSFYVEVPVNLKRIYELADMITFTQDKSRYAEKWTIDLLETYSFGPDESKIPPSVANVFDPGSSPIYWTKSGTNSFIKNNILPSHIPLLSVLGTSNQVDRYGFYERTILPILSPSNYSYSDLEVTFEYIPFWPIFYDVSGRGVSGELIGPETGFVSYFSFIGINRYVFYHDLSFPIKVDIYDPNALSGKGYHFTFALEANIRNNKPINCSKGNTPLAISPPATSMLCNRGHGRLNITVFAVDHLTGETLEDVKILYGTSAEGCDLGMTKRSDSGIANKVIEFPQLIGGTLNAVKFRYFSTPRVYSSFSQADAVRCDLEQVLCDGETITIDMTRQMPMNISIMKIPYLKGLVGLDDGPVWELRTDLKKDLLPDESAIAIFEKVKEYPGEEDLSVSVFFNKTRQTVEVFPGFVPGEYKVSITLLYSLPDISGRQSVIFKEVTETVPSSNPLEDGDEITLGPYEFNNTFLEGGAEYYVNISQAEILLGDMELYAISVPDSLVFDMLDFNDLSLLGNYVNISHEYYSDIRPKFS